jgi:6-phosphogluconolactonase/glucosamine-6-phosphate isomerase/deaminase
VVTFNLDEYVGFEADHAQSYARFMDEQCEYLVSVLPENVKVSSITPLPPTHVTQLTSQSSPKASSRHPRLTLVDLPPGNTHLLCGSPRLIPLEECARYEALITKYGGVQLLLASLGENGHVAFNEPGSGLGRTRVVRLDQGTRQVNVGVPRVSRPHVVHMFTVWGTIRTLSAASETRRAWDTADRPGTILWR